MTCSQIIDLLDDYRRGTLSAEDAASIASHLANCDACARELAARQGLGNLIASGAKPTAQPSPEALAEAVNAALGQVRASSVVPIAPPPSHATRARSTIIPRVLEIAAAFLVGAITTVLLWNPIQPDRTVAYSVTPDAVRRLPSRGFESGPPAAKSAATESEQSSDKMDAVLESKKADESRPGAPLPAAAPATFAPPPADRSRVIQAPPAGGIAGDIAAAATPVLRMAGRPVSEQPQPADPAVATDYLAVPDTASKGQIARSAPTEPSQPGLPAVSGQSTASEADSVRKLAVGTAVSTVGGLDSSKAEARVAEEARTGAPPLPASTAAGAAHTVSQGATPARSARAEAAPTPPADAPSVFLAALDAETREQFAGALVLYDKVISLDPDGPHGARARLRAGIIAAEKLPDPVQARNYLAPCLQPPVSNHLDQATQSHIRAVLDRQPAPQP